MNSRYPSVLVCLLALLGTEVWVESKPALAQVVLEEGGGLSAALPYVVGRNFDKESLNSGDSLIIRVNRLPSPNEGNLYLVVGHTDVTPLLHASADGELILDSAVQPLPKGESEVVLYLVTPGGEWKEVSRTTLRLRTPAFESSEFAPRMDLNNKGQLSEGHSLDAGAPPRKTYQDFAVQAGVTGRQTRGDLEIRTAVNLVGSTVQEEALRFGEKGEEAPKLDLSDYLVEVDKGKARFAMGHITYGNNPMLLSGVGNRGLKARYRFNERFDVSVTSMNGTSVVGYSNIFGLNTLDHNISAATVGIEVLPSRPGGLRMELTYLDASIESQFNFDVGEVPDAETNRGAGLRVLGSSPSGRLRGDFSIARSRYRNPNDPFLAQGSELVEVKPTTDVARRFELSYDLLQNKQINESLYASLSLSYTHDRADPLYRSVGAFTQADWEANQVALNGQLGTFSLQAQYLEGEDNIEDLPSILKTKTQNTAASLSIPVATLLGAAQTPSPWWPSLSYNYNRGRQYAANDPNAADSGFNGGSHLPDQVNTSHGISIQWALPRWSAEYQLELNDQDNRQVGRKQADFKILTHNANVGVQATASLNLSASVSLGKNADKEQELDRETRSWSLNADWGITPRWAFNGSYTATKQDDSQDLSLNTSTSANAQLNWRFSLPGGSRRLPGQVFVRYALQENDLEDRLFGFESNIKTWTLNSGISLSLF